MSQKQNQGQGMRTLSDLGTQKEKRRRIPDAFKYSIFGSLGWCVLACILYSSGVFTHKGDTLDQFISWSSGACGIFGLVFLAFAIVWFEEQ